MIKRLKQLALGSCAVVFVLACATGLARAAVTSLVLNQKAVAVADSGHTAITMSGSIQCRSGDTVLLYGTTLQAKSGTQGGVYTPTFLACTGYVQDYSIEVDVTLPADGAFQNGPAVGVVAARDTTDGTEADIIGKLVITGSQ